MTASPKAISKALISATQKEPDRTDELVAGCVTFLETNNLLHHKDAILRYLKRAASEEQRYNTLRVRAAQEPSHDLLGKIKASLNVDAEAPLSIHLDDSMAGGVVAEYRGKILDTSIETILTRLTHSLTA